MLPEYPPLYLIYLKMVHFSTLNLHNSSFWKSTAPETASVALFWECVQINIQQNILSLLHYLKTIIIIFRSVTL